MSTVEPTTALEKHLSAENEWLKENLKTSSRSVANLVEENERLREENAGLRGNLKGNPVLSTFDGIAKLRAENERLEAELLDCSRITSEQEAEVERLRAEVFDALQALNDALNSRDEAVRQVRNRDDEVERLRAALSRYGDHDRACESRENALHVCTCGFDAMIQEQFPARQALEEK